MKTKYIHQGEFQGIHGVFNLYSETGNEPQRLANERAAREASERRAAEGDPKQPAMPQIFGPDLPAESEGK